MKSNLFAAAMLLLMATFTLFLTSCDKDPIVEEDLNGFDVQQIDLNGTPEKDESLEAKPGIRPEHLDEGPSVAQIDAASQIQTEEDVLNQQIEGYKIMKDPNEDNMFVVYPEEMPMAQVLESLKPADQRTKRSVANPKMIFDNTPGTQGIMIRRNPQGGYCGMGSYTGGVTFVLDANPFACAGELYLCTDLRMDWRQVVYVSGCNTSKLRYINSSGSLTDTDYMTREGYNWLYMRCSSELASHNDIRQGQCESSYSGKFCDE